MALDGTSHIFQTDLRGVEQTTLCLLGGTQRGAGELSDSFVANTASKVPFHQGLLLSHTYPEERGAATR